MNQREEGRITDELRHYIEGSEQLYGYEYKRSRAIADRIDSEHEEALREAYTKGREDGMGMANAKDAQAEYLRGKNDGYDEGWDAGFASADDWCAQHEDAMAEHGWVKLPVDADGEYIHVGDRMENNERVARIVLTDDSWEPSVYLEKLPNVLHEYFCHEISHYHAPTVEDVLRDMHAKLDEVTALYVGEAIDSDERDSDEARIFAEYAAKLRLAGDVE